MASQPTALVIGAGIMGLSAAWALARQGHAVRVLEQDAIPNPRGASVDQHRLIRHAYGSEVGYMRMVDAAFAAWETLWAELGERLYIPTGVLGLAERPGGWLAQSRAAMDAAARPFESLPPEAITTRWPMLLPGGIHAACHCPAGGVLLASRIIAALAARCRALGVGIDAAARATAVDPTRASVTLADGSQRGADLLVIAAGCWLDRLLPDQARRITPSRQVVVMLQPPPAHRAAWEAAPMVLDLAEDGGFYAVPPVAGTPLKIGDHRFSLQGDAGEDRRARPGEAEAILALARHRIRDLDDFRILDATACHYDVAAEERFILEPLGHRAWLMTGFSGHGFKFGPLLGLALAAAVGDAALAPGLPGWAAGRTAPPPGLLDTLHQ